MNIKHVKDEVVDLTNGNRIVKEDKKSLHGY